MSENTDTDSKEALIPEKNCTANTPHKNAAQNECITKIIGNYLRILTLLVRFDDVIIAHRFGFVKKFFQISSQV